MHAQSTRSAKGDEEAGEGAEGEGEGEGEDKKERPTIDSCNC